MQPLLRRAERRAGAVVPIRGRSSYPDRGMWVAAVALLVAALWLAPAAAAQVRTANGINANRLESGAPASPVLDGLSARYDPATGDLMLTVIFFEPLAETAALQGWEVAIYLADNVGTDEAPFCVPLLSPHNLLVTFSLGEDRPAEVDQYGVGSYNLRWTVSPDRRSLVLHSVDARLANLMLMCANVDLNGPNGEYSFIGASLFSGFGPLDGNLGTTGRWHLASEVADLNNRLGRARRDPPLGAFPRCRRTGRTELHCSGRSRLRDVTGRPTVAVSGRMRVSYTRGLRTRWRHDMRATLSWRRCPGRVDRQRAGRRCSLARRWRRGSLGSLFRRAARAAGTPQAGSPAYEALRVSRRVRAGVR